MKTPEQIAQWVIDNRYPKSEKEKVSDSEMFHQIICDIRLLNTPIETPNKWVCQKCGELVDARNVTFEEYHEGCGGRCV